MLISCLLLGSCTAHAFLYLDDMISGFVPPQNLGTSQVDQDVGALKYFSTPRFNLLACFFLYVFNVRISSSNPAAMYLITCRAFATMLSLCVRFSLCSLPCLMSSRYGECSVVSRPNREVEPGGMVVATSGVGAGLTGHMTYVSQY